MAMKQSRCLGCNEIFEWGEECCPHCLSDNSVDEWDYLPENKYSEKEVDYGC